MKFFIVGGNRYGERSILIDYGFLPVPTMEEADLVVFTGGQDINPALYGEEAHRSVYFTQERDDYEVEAFKRATALKKAFLGICRGAQLLNVLVGGKLYQDIAHPAYHELTTFDGQKFLSNSVHHQMLRPTKDAIIAAWTESLSPYHRFMEAGEEQNDVTVEQEPEIVVYQKQRMVLVQGHPEFDYGDDELHPFREFVFNLVKEQVNASI